MTRLRVWLVGFGTVGRWLVRALDAEGERIARRHGVEIAVVGVASAREGFVHDARGFDLRALAARGVSLGELPGDLRAPTALEGIRATDADALVEVAASRASDGEPGVAHMREALGRGLPVVTSNKWPVALRGVELAALARRNGAAFRAESTVMSGTPVLSALAEGLAGATPLGLRGVLNATVNAILTAMTDGATYHEALAAAQRAGLAERDPSADVDGHDAVAKLMILSALVFGRQLRSEDVGREGVSGVTPAQVAAARARGARVKHVVTLAFSEPDGRGTVAARVAPEAVGADDPLARVDGATNAVVFRARPVGEVTIAGPGAGPELAGQGALSDLIAVARA